MTRGDIVQLPCYSPKGNLLFNIRGTNGSGKTYTLREFLGEPNKVDEWRGYRIQDFGSYCILGNYSNACGGLDGVREFSSVKAMVAERIPHQHVMMEGVLWSTVYKSSIELDNELREGGHTMFWMFLNTSAERCLRQICQRRLAACDERPLPTDNVLAKIKGMNGSMVRAANSGAWVRVGSPEEHQHFIRKCLESPRQALGIHMDNPTPLQPVLIESGIPSEVCYHIAGVQQQKANQVNSMFDMFS